MKCPNCEYKWPRYTSWKYNTLKGVTCPKCATVSVREGKFQPMLIAIIGICLYGYLYGTFNFTFVGQMLVLFLVLLFAMWIDERWIKLVPKTPPDTPPDGPRADGAAD